MKLRHLLLDHTEKTLRINLLDNFRLVPIKKIKIQLFI